MGEGILRSKEHFDVNPRPLAGEGRVRVLCPPGTVFSKERKKKGTAKAVPFFFPCF
jgi:hypothetical protein